ncbi:MAG: hypothetical protein Crog4KO_06310 [Crocinitomicaceae bacterium]
MRFIILFLTVSMLSLTSCGEEKKGVKGQLTPRAKIDIQLDSSQVVLTNEYAFNDGRYSKGGASFLLQGKNEKMLCTAKHLLGEAMGISPRVHTSELEGELNYWCAFASNDSIFRDTLNVKRVVNKKESQTDILLFNHIGVLDDLAVLKPRFTKPGLQEELELIAYEFNSDQQQRFTLEMDEFKRSSYIVRAKEKFNPRGMSGSPVLDKNGYVIGVLVGGGHFEGELYLTVEPLSLVKNYLD